MMGFAQMSVPAGVTLHPSDAQAAYAMQFVPPGYFAPMQFGFSPHHLMPFGGAALAARPGQTAGSLEQQLPLSTQLLSQHHLGHGYPFSHAALAASRPSVPSSLGAQGAAPPAMVESGLQTPLTSTVPMPADAVIKSQGKLDAWEKRRVDEFVQHVQHERVWVAKGDLARQLRAFVNPERPQVFYEKLISRRNLNQRLRKKLSAPRRIDGLLQQSWWGW
jgi:hypothetical protein